MTAVPMTRTRWAALAAGLPIAFALIALAVNSWVRAAVVHLVNSEQFSYPMSVSAPATGGRVRVSVINANVTVRPGARGPGQRIRVHGRVSGTGARPVFQHQVTPAGLRLGARCPLPIAGCTLNAAITAPAGLPVSVGTSFGNLDARNLSGTVALSDNSGDLSASGLSGTIRLSDSFGSLTAAGLSDSIRLTANASDIAASRVTGDTRLADSFGEVTVTGLAAPDVVATDQFGDIILTFIRVPRLVQVTDSFGSVTVRLPPGRATYRVRAATTFGSTTVSVPRSPAAAHVITVDDKSGDITIVAG
jgi:hypothetical protein